MQIQFTVIGDDLNEIAAELIKIAAQFQGQAMVTTTFHTTKPEPEKKEKPKKTKKEPEPEPETEQVEAETEQVGDGDDAGDKSNPEADWKKATDLLMKHWNENPDDAEKVLAVAQEFGVAKFRDIPTEKGTEFLAAAKKVVG